MRGGRFAPERNSKRAYVPCVPSLDLPGVRGVERGVGVWHSVAGWTDRPEVYSKDVLIPGYIPAWRSLAVFGWRPVGLADCVDWEIPSVWIAVSLGSSGNGRTGPLLILLDPGTSCMEQLDTCVRCSSEAKKESTARAARRQVFWVHSRSLPVRLQFDHSKNGNDQVA